MDWFPLIRDSLHVQPSANSFETFFVNAFEHPDVPAIVGSLAGYEYVLPPLAQLRPVVRVRALTNTQIVAPPGARGADAGLRVPGDYTNWFITLREPTGAFIAKDAPLQQFVQDSPTLGSRDRVVYSRAVRNWWIDPRQSYVYCTQDNATDLVALQFQYQ